MISNDEVKNLASLARVALSPEEETKLAGELGQILDYVSLLQEVTNSSSEALAKEDGMPAFAKATADKNYNKLREDGAAEASLSEEEREKLLGGKFLQVKKIL